MDKTGKEKEVVGKITTDHEGRGKTIFTPAAQEGLNFYIFVYLFFSFIYFISCFLFCFSVSSES